MPVTEENIVTSPFDSEPEVPDGVDTWSFHKEKVVQKITEFNLHDVVWQGDIDTGEVIKFGEAITIIEHVAMVLRNRVGICPGDSVIVHSTNHLIYCAILHFAVPASGAHAIQLAPYLLRK